MKFLKILLFIIAILLVVFFILAMLGAKTFDVNRSITVDASTSDVYAQVSSLKNMDKWSPWREDDPEMVSEIHGQDGSVGAYSHWEGPNSGVGEQKLIKLNENERVETELRFIEPFEGLANAYFDISESEAGGTKVVWGFKGEQNLVMRAMSMLPGKDMESSMGPTFERGLKNLKAHTEAEVEKNKNVNIKKFGLTIAERPATSYLAKKSVVPMEAIAEFCSSNYGPIATAIGVSGNEIQGSASAIYYVWNEEKGTTEMAVGFPVSGDLNIQGYETLELEAGRYVKAVYTGNYDQAMTVYAIIDEYIANNRLIQDGPVLEEYPVGPSTESDPSKWVTHVYMSIK